MPDSIGEIEDIERGKKRRREQMEEFGQASKQQSITGTLRGGNRISHIPDSPSRLRRIFGKTIGN